MRENSEKCLICGKTGFKNSNGFTKHLRIHKISTENYYLFYIDHTAGICEVCGKEVKFSSIDKGFPKLCRKCHNRDPKKFEKSKETMLRKYGAENASQVEEFKEKRKQTNLKRYGVEHAMSNPEINQRCLKTWEKNYEEGHPGRNKEIKEKKKNTCQERYGVDNISKLPEIKDQVRQKISGSNHYNWNPDRNEVNKKYGKEFFNSTLRDKIKAEQSFLDPLSGDQLKKFCQLHHIDYDKSNNERQNLIYLNLKTHKKIHKNKESREHWKKILSKINELFVP